VPLTDWSLRAGGRLSYNDYSGNLYLEPRIRVEYRLDPRMSFSLASGNYIQPIRRVAEQNLFLRQPDRWRLSDGDLLPESRSFHTSLGMHYEHKRFQASVEGYYKRLKGVVLNQEQNRLLSAFTVENEQLSIGKGEVIGADLMVNYEQGAHSAWLAYSYTYSANVFEDIDDGDPMPSTYNKPHDIKMVYDYRYRDYTFHSQWTASTGYPYTPVLGVFEGPGGDPFLVYGEELSARLPDQFRWDISLSRHFSLRDMDLHLGAGIFNLTDHRNIRTRTYSTNQVRDEAPEELRINTIDLELIGLSPTFSLRLDFR
ncbi:MAG: TonB-dependent receptor, partial [Flavobacteriales bacterium]|nr:TonB-dependent receptor [Flavobacteriales bacterium]